MSRKTIILLIIGAVLLIIAGGVGSYVISKKLFSLPQVTQNLSKNLPTLPFSPVNDSNSTRINFSLAGIPSSVQSGQTFTVNVIVSSNENILASDLDISYDPSKLLLQKIVPGGLFASPMEFSKSIDTKTGKIFYALGSLSGSSGNGTIATLTFKVLSNLTQPKIYLGDKTFASVKGDKKINIILSSH